jgi:hypothetical protein
MRTTCLAGAGALLLLASRAPAARAADCGKEAAAQIHDLAAFSHMVGIDGCATESGKAQYREHVALLRKLDGRNGELARICPADDPSFVYARKTLVIQTRVFGSVSKGCK